MNENGKIMSFLSRLGDMFILNIMYLICCVPIVTIGAATTALYYNTLKIAENREGYVWKDFLKSFRQNFKQATIIWTLILGATVILGIDFFLVGGISSQAVVSVIGSVVVVLGIFLILVSVYVFPILARFENSVSKIIKYSLIMSIRHLPSTVIILLIHSIPLLLAVVSLEAFVKGLFPVLLFTVSILAYFESKIFTRIFRYYYPKTEGRGFIIGHNKKKGGCLLWQNKQR